MILEDKTFVSMSELREKTSQVVKDVNIFGKKIILSQNKPVGVFLSISEYNNIIKTNFPSEKATKEDIKNYKKSSHGKDTVEAFSFLETLK